MLLHEDLLHAETNQRLEHAREARLKHGFVMLRRWRRRAEAARAGVERALALERERMGQTPLATAPATPVGIRSAERLARWA
jgi:septal ring factor EnvC (AmiA/AmiB activator)